MVELLIWVMKLRLMKEIRCQNWGLSQKIVVFWGFLGKLFDDYGSNWLESDFRPCEICPDEIYPFWV